MKKIIVAAMVVVAGFGLSACGSSAPAPAPTVTVTAAPEVSETPTSAGLSILAGVWETLSVTEKSNACEAYAISPDLFWTKFTQGLADNGVSLNGLTQDEFFSFLGSKCPGV